MHLFDVLLTSGRVWLFTIIGIIAAVCAWFFLSESANRLAVAGWSITIGYLIGWLLSLLPSRETE